MSTLLQSPLARQWRLLLALDAAPAAGLTFEQITASGACSERTAHQDVDSSPASRSRSAQPAPRASFLNRETWQRGEGTIFNRQGH